MNFNLGLGRGRVWTTDTWGSFVFVARKAKRKVLFFERAILDGGETDALCSLEVNVSRQLGFFLWVWVLFLIVFCLIYFVGELLFLFNYRYRVSYSTMVLLDFKIIVLRNHLVLIFRVVSNIRWLRFIIYYQKS